MIGWATTEIATAGLLPKAQELQNKYNHDDDADDVEDIIAAHSGTSLLACSMEMERWSSPRFAMSATG